MTHHYSDCSLHNGPAYPAGPCDCGFADRRIAELEAALWLLVGDVEAMHRSHVPSPGEPPITANEIANLERAKALLVGYEPSEADTVSIA